MATEKTMTKRWSPLCFDSLEQFNRWWTARRVADKYGAEKVASYCQDCTVAYQAAMTAARRCTHPDLVLR